MAISEGEQMKKVNKANPPSESTQSIARREDYGTGEMREALDRPQISIDRTAGLDPTALTVDCIGAREYSLRHPTHYIFPVRVAAAEFDPGGAVSWWQKLPLCRWTQEASNDPDEVERLFRRAVGGGLAQVGVSCRPSEIWVLDQDRDLPPGHPLCGVLQELIDGQCTLVRLSCTRSMPHFYFRQGSPEMGTFVAEGRWDGGDVKSSGFVVVGKDVLVDAPIARAPKGLLDQISGRTSSLRRPRGQHQSIDKEELKAWLASTPDEETRLIDVAAEDKFLARVVDRFWHRVETGDHRRMAVLIAVHVAAMEAAAGLYSAQEAFETIGDAYHESREMDPNPSKRWDDQRERDYLNMWKGSATKTMAGELDDEIDDLRQRIIEEYDVDDELDWDWSEIADIFRGNSD